MSSGPMTLGNSIQCMVTIAGRRYAVHPDVASEIAALRAGCEADQRAKVLLFWAAALMGVAFILAGLYAVSA